MPIAGVKKEYSLLYFSSFLPFSLGARISSFESQCPVNIHALSPEDGELYLSNALGIRTCPSQSEVNLISPLSTQE